MASQNNLRRSSRPKKTFTYITTATYPDTNPSTPVEKWISKLDLETFPSNDYARVDDILVYSLFASKKKPDVERALRPTRAFLETEPPISNLDAMRICRIYLQLAQSSNDSPFVASKVTKEIVEKFPNLFHGKRDQRILLHLLQRYHIMNYSGPQAIRLEKVRFHQGTITCGLKASAVIEPSVVILTSCSSMSSDIVSCPAVSVINSTANQKGKVGPRLILGPFRFANHDCAPNCQITAIPGTSAYALCTIRRIMEGEPITVNYAKDGSYFGGQKCGCATCNPDSPPVARKRPFDPFDFLPDPTRPKRKRGGKRARRKLQDVPGESLGPRAAVTSLTTLPSLFTLSGQAPLPYS